MTDNIQALKPCPLCGCKSITIHKPTYRELTLFGIACDECGVRIKRFDESDAIAAWNRRVPCTTN
ncbi:Lar family restriction alleviation protein [Morganella psychrotolerans]|uniref:Lar family restriction alleviation protein n=1 Tax=Morganella psychrotolerans TaxID=368603 RepID=UPI000943CE24